MILPLVYYGNKILRTKCHPVETIDSDLLQLVENMIETMDVNKGIGIAAPQVGRMIQLFVLRNYLETPDGETALSLPQVYLNPKVTHMSKETLFETEGCLSIPGVRETVERPFQITIEAMDLEGKVFKEEISGYNARVRLHEYDHLQGVLFIDKISKGRRKKLEPILQQITKAHPAFEG